MRAAFELPIFPLQTVLFPGGVLPLRIFEQRYLGLAKRCIRDDVPFGVCLIARGQEVGAPALPHDVGSTARITEWDMPQFGVLNVTTRGERRFRILEQRADVDGLIQARAEWVEGESPQAVPAALQQLVPLLQAIVADAGAQRMPGPHEFDDAEWVGFRYAEVLPIPALARQKLLELDDCVSRLEIIHTYLSQRGLVS